MKPNSQDKPLVIIEDTRQKPEKHKIKNEYFQEQGVRVIRSKLPYGDYANIQSMAIVIDTKKDIQELIIDVTKDHERFIRECELARECGSQLIILTENKDRVRQINDLAKWYNWRLKKSPRATTGKTLMKILHTIEKDHGAKFYFCEPDESGPIIVEILSQV